MILISRSLLTIRISSLVAKGLSTVVNQSWKKFYSVLSDFATTGILATIVNASLKYLKKIISIIY